ncbi:ACN9 family protein [Cavenderia fasciculata]|uniref:Succinate dehydrogenase assembly factor 3 n=1 Tax=Cavenderia fasciculata TaxID=261658 RepID=F4PRJ0_CACFS|nr:ACN9 family protein [Cavenderia fasciculata]EGG21330.1 ACN9 family protein [Cavenderia fasciculata]|eukprot:XP_004359180.1 ACN9 family protein [Cavenderia fasciculata]
MYSKDQFLSLYRGLLRCHRILQEPIKSMGDQYVRTEWRLHLKTDKKTAFIFYKKWQEYLDFMLTQHQKNDDLLNNTIDGQNNDSNALPSFGRHMTVRELEKLNDEQKGQLSKLKIESFQLFEDDADGESTIIDPDITNNKK